MNNLVPFQDMTLMADSIAKSGLFGMKNVNEVLALMLVAQAEGLHPATAARDYHIIQGRPALKADAMLARFQQAGGKVDWKSYTDQLVTGIFTHPNGGTLELSWSIEQATKAGLNKPGSGWSKYPRAMLRARVVSEGIRSVYPGCVIGTYTPEEVSDFDDKPVKMRDITPQPVELPHNVIAHPDEGNINHIGELKAEVMYSKGEPTWPLNLPDGSVYSGHHNAEDWIAAYCDMVEKIGKSTKLKHKDKADKVKDLKTANKGCFSRLSPIQMGIIVQTTGQALGAIPEPSEAIDIPKPLGPIMTAEEFHEYDMMQRE
jgi:hypothetical protein